MLMHTFSDESYFFEWALASGNLDKIRFVLSELRKKLDELDRRFSNNTLSPSIEYHIAIQNIEFDCKKLADFLIRHESIDSFLYDHLYFLEKINTEFREHFINKFLPLKAMLLQSTIHDSVFGKWLSKTPFYNFIRMLSSNLKNYFSQLDSLYDEIHDTFMNEFVEAIRKIDHNPILFQNFIKNHPGVILLFIRHIGTLEHINKAFQQHHQPLVDSSVDIDDSTDIDYLGLVKALYDFYSEDLQPSPKTKSHTEYTEEEKKESLARLNALASNIRDVSKYMQPSHESPTAFNLAFRYIKRLYKETAIAIKKAKGDTRTVVNCLEELDSFLTSFLDLQQYLDIQLSWVKEKLFIGRQSVEKTKELAPEWIQDLNNFEYIVVSSENKEILQTLSLALQQSNGNTEKILAALKSFEDRLHFIVSSYPPEFKHSLATKISWVKITLERLQSKANITHFKKIESGKGKEEEEEEEVAETELPPDFERKLTVSFRP